MGGAVGREIGRRRFLAGSVAALAALPQLQAKGGTSMIWIGCYTTKGSKGIYVLPFDATTGGVSEPVLAAETPDPSFLAMHPSKPFLYAVNEMEGKVSAFAVEADGQTLRALNQRTSGGKGPCHLTLDHTGRMLVVANYNSGSFATYQVHTDGNLSAAVTTVQFKGSGPDHARQEGPHAHCAVVTPDNHGVLVNDLGTDQTMVYRIHPETGVAEAAQPPFAAANPGAGPRHLVFGPTKQWMYVVNEMGSSVTRFRYDASVLGFTKMDTVSTLPSGFHGQNTAAEIAVSPNGRFLYTSNRGHDSIAAFRIEPDGSLHFLGTTPSGGKTPRSFAFHQSGKWMLAAHQDSDNITVFEADPSTGMVRLNGQSVHISSPVCLMQARSSSTA